MSRMTRFDWCSRQSRRQTFARQHRRLCVEQLEDRRMLAVITVTSSADDLVVNGMVTLREAIQAANTNASVDGSVTGSGFDTIQFAAPLSGQTITLGGTDIEITEALTIDARALAENVTIFANEQSRIFDITAPSGASTLAGLTLTGGKVTGDQEGGGAIRSRSVGSLTLTIDRSTISGNSTNGIQSYGGGLDVNGGLTISNSTVSGNRTYGGQSQGGGIQAYGDVTLTNSTVSGNQTPGGTGYGGGIFTRNDATLTNSTVSGNSGNLGGGIHAERDVTLHSSTVTDNFSNIGGGIWSDDYAMTIHGSIVAGNTASVFGPDVFPGFSRSSAADYSLIGDTAGSGITVATGIGNILDQPALLGPLAANGGPPLTHTLLAGSPALNAGDPAAVAGTGNVPQFDQRGTPFLRVVSVIDMGAVESLRSVVVDTLIDESDGDFSPGDLSLREALELTNTNPGADTITFNATLAGGTINLGIGELTISDDVTLMGLGADQLTIDAQLASRVMRVTINATADISGLTLTRGSADRGGGLRSDVGTTTTLSAVVIQGNTATTTDLDSGGGLWSKGDLTVTDSLITGNMAAGSGGGVWNNNYLTISNSTLSGNMATGNGGGVYAEGITAIRHSTISGNSAETGGGIGIVGGAIDHTIVANNTASVAGNDVVGSATANWSLIENTAGSTISGANNITGMDPALDSLADNGGLTLTHALLLGSPAIAAGDPAKMAGMGEVPLFDQRGDNFGRVQNGRIDIGAYEVGETVSADFDGDNDIDGADFLAWQRGVGITSPNASKVDGDADNDLDVDGDDLFVWVEQFGQPAPLVAAAQTVATVSRSKEGFSSANGPTASASLIDAAMAWMRGSESASAAEFVNEDSIAEVLASDERSSAVLPTAELDGEPEEHASSSEAAEADDVWLSDELLERVFG